MGIRPSILALIAAAALPAARSDTTNSPQTVAAAMQPPGIIQRLPLTELAPYSVGINDTLPTTILLPDVPAAFTGVGFTKDRITAAPVFIEHTPGTTWFTVRALMPQASADLNILMGDKVYTFHFYFSLTPHRTLTIFAPVPAPAQSAPRAPQITVKRLIDILDDAKSYLIVQATNPNLYRPIQYDAPGTVTPYRGFKVVTDRVFKFPSDDTIVFRIVFVNEQESELLYDPQVIGVRVRGTVATFWKSISDLDGRVPPAHREKYPDGSEKIVPGESFGYFAITGNPDGTKARLSLKNVFDVLVKRESPAPPPVVVPASVLPTKKPTA